MSTHTFNEAQKRFEPINTKCSFCNSGAHSTSKGDHCYISMYSIKDRTNLVVYRNVKFNEVKIGLPRCKHCSNVHSTVKIFDTLGLIIGVLSVFVVPIAICVVFDIRSKIVMFMLLAMMFGVVYFVNKGIENYILSSNKTLSQKDASLKEPIVIELLRMGWSLDRPSA